MCQTGSGRTNVMSAKRKRWGWVLIAIGLALLAVSEFVPNILIDLFASILAMLVGGVGIYFTFDDAQL